ncbi:MAG: hypothetical protein D6755_03820 [Anaerolineae bacterium]|nr:MAG: hypothetical protein D6755_03820 [Anaerolineae bacterium]
MEFLNPHLEPFRPYLGKTWRGTAIGEGAPKVQDISHWERALNGQAIRILHSLNNGEYGGETILMWDEAAESLTYYYFTTAGFYTHGSMRIEGETFISREEVSGNAEGITVVEAIGRLLPDGRMESRSRYLQNGVWVEGHAFVYEEDPLAKVIFR